MLRWRKSREQSAAVCGEISPPPWEKCKSFLGGVYQTVKGNNMSAFCLTCSLVKTKREDKQWVQTSQLCIYHCSMSTQVFDMLFILGGGWAPQLPSVTQVQPWTWPDAWLWKQHKQSKSDRKVNYLTQMQTPVFTIQYLINLLCKSCFPLTKGRFVPM